MSVGAVPVLPRTTHLTSLLTQEWEKRALSRMALHESTLTPSSYCTVYATNCLRANPASPDPASPASILLRSKTSQGPPTPPWELPHLNCLTPTAVQLVQVSVKSCFHPPEDNTEHSSNRDFLQIPLFRRDSDPHRDRPVSTHTANLQLRMRKA